MAVWQLTGNLITQIRVSGTPNFILHTHKPHISSSEYGSFLVLTTFCVMVNCLSSAGICILDPGKSGCVCTIDHRVCEVDDRRSMLMCSVDIDRGIARRCLCFLQRWFPGTCRTAAQSWCQARGENCVKLEQEISKESSVPSLFFSFFGKAVKLCFLHYFFPHSSVWGEVLLCES